MPPNDKTKVYIFGASGSGTTTLGAALADALSLVHVDADDHYWAPVDPPYSVKRTPEERRASLEAALGSKGWVLSGACDSWAGHMLQQADLLVFLFLPSDLRVARLIARETQEFGARIEEGGDMHGIHTGFLEWAKGYDDPAFQGRSLAAHETWMATQSIPICRIEQDQPVSASLDQVLLALQKAQQNAK
ncbi:MAG: adenylate kinase [Arenibacterium sp.]